MKTAARIARSAIVLAVCGAAAGWGLSGADLPRGNAWLSPTKTRSAFEQRARGRGPVRTVRIR